jgi:hypothetical protein
MSDGECKICGNIILQNEKTFSVIFERSIESEKYRVHEDCHYSTEFKLISRIEKLEDNQKFLEEMINNEQNSICRIIANILDSVSMLDKRLGELQQQHNNVSSIVHQIERHETLTNKILSLQDILEKLEQKESSNG